MDSKRIIVAIDGPAGAGKSTIARRVAERLGYLYINSGALYRAIALWALRLGTELSDMHRLGQLAKEAALELTDEGRVILNGEDVTDAIWDSEVSEASSKVSAVPEVRRALLEMQRRMAETHSVVMEGRDIGSVVFPEAQIKIFLDAASGERARRRSGELPGIDAGQVESDLKQRDTRDRERIEAPLVQSPDAHLIDSTNMTIEQVEEAVLRLVRSRISNGKSAKQMPPAQ